MKRELKFSSNTKRTSGADYPPGPWNNEPDKVQWVDPTTDLDCLIVRGPSGALCGYVGVYRDHPAYGKDYEDVDVQVHGGLTFAAKCQEHDPEGICHVPEPGRDGDVWWLGFDCAHAYDLMPVTFSYPDYTVFQGDVYRDINYVTAECESLALQLSELPNRER